MIERLDQMVNTYEAAAAKAYGSGDRENGKIYESMAIAFRAAKKIVMEG